MEETKKPVVLVIEDDEHILKLLKIIFEMFFEEHEVHYATSVEETSKLITELTVIDKVIMDHEIVNGNTEKFIPIILKKFPKCRILASSSKESARQVELGAHQKLDKPFNIPELQQALKL